MCYADGTLSTEKLFLLNVHRITQCLVLNVTVIFWQRIMTKPLCFQQSTKVDS